MGGGASFFAPLRGTRRREDTSSIRRRLHSISDAAGVLGLRELAPAIGSPGTPMAFPTVGRRPTPAEARAHLRSRTLHG